MSTIFVTGATGTVGSQVTEELLKAGATLRIGARNPQKAAAWAERGAEVVAFDFDKPETLRPAMRGVDTMFLLTPFVEEFVSLVRLALDAAKAEGVKHIVRLSVVGASPEVIGPPQQHGVADNLLKDSGIAWTLIQPTFFQDNVWNYSLGTILGQSAIYGAAGDQKISYVSAADIAKVTRTVLLNPAAHAGKSYALTGPEALSEAEVAAIISENIGKTVSYVNLTPDQYAGGLRGAQLPEWMISHLVALEYIKSQGWAAAVAPGVQDVLGQPAQSMKDYVAANKHRLAGQ